MSTLTDRVVTRFKLAVNMDHAIDWWVNVFGKGKLMDYDPVDDLAYVLHDRRAAQRMWDAYERLSKQEKRAFERLLDEGDPFALEEVLEKWVGG